MHELSLDARVPSERTLRDFISYFIFDFTGEIRIY